jgi:integrase/recombinase XerD
MGRRAQIPRILLSASDPLTEDLDRFLDWTRSIGLAEQTVAIRRFALRQFIRWCWVRGISRAEQVRLHVLEEYQAHLALRRKRNGEPLALNTRVTRLNPLKAFFKWMARTGRLPANPAIDLCIPRIPRRLPGRIPSLAEIWKIMAAPDVATATGVRDRQFLKSSMQPASGAWSS